MFILTKEGFEDDGAYSVANEYGEHVLYLFEEQDDAERYSLMLEDRGYYDMSVIEVDDDLLLQACEINEYKYTIITPNDIVIPPEDLKDDSIS
jgi:hypothetical protein